MSKELNSNSRAPDSLQQPREVDHITQIGFFSAIKFLFTNRLSPKICKEKNEDTDKDSGIKESWFCFLWSLFICVGIIILSNPGLVKQGEWVGILRLWPHLLM